MTIPQKNEAIARMLGWEEDDGSWVLPWDLTQGSDLSQWADTRKNDEGGFNYLVSSYHLHFDGDANWQFEAIEWIEKRGYNVHIHQARTRIERNDVGLLSGMPDCDIEVRSQQVDFDKRSSIFEALYEFSQHMLKPKE